MNKKYKKIYIEIINYCNLNCPFCEKTKRPKEMMTIDHFSHVLDEIKPYTDYIYLHVQGEPLMHKDIKSFLDIANEKGFFVNITTNATLLGNNIDLLINAKAVRQINISLQALLELPNKELYYDNIIKLIKENKNIYISLRLWGDFSTEKVQNELQYFEKQLNIKSNIEETNRLKERLYVSKAEKFKWPSLDDDFNSSLGSCEAIHQLAILANGDVIPCCLDKDGIMTMGNIFTTPLKDILLSNRYQEMISSFRKGKLTEELCKHCTYLNRFKKS